MAKQLQLRKGTTTEHNTFTGAVGEVTVDTTNKTLVVHDGVTAGGTPLLNASQLVDSTTTVKGVTRFATDTEVVNKSNVSAAVTPKNVVDMFISTQDSETLPTGRQIKWGDVDYSSRPTEGDLSVSFSNAFTTDCFTVMLTRKVVQNSSALQNDGGVLLVSKTKSGFIVNIANFSTDYGGLRGFTWLAIGA